NVFEVDENGGGWVILVLRIAGGVVAVSHDRDQRLAVDLGFVSVRETSVFFAVATLRDPL
ncbi:MAG TPA: hypothetical protein VM911_15415, partial [Pyrinomonadaceae bacterium]|nr:hypothetical protein [Pyrinomonadaceae bacterium]